MPHYYVNKFTDDHGHHEVHKEGCSHMPKPDNRKYLGLFSNCHDAVREAKKFYITSNGCKHCSPECDTGES